MFPAQFTMITKTKSTIFLINFLVSNNTKWLLVSVVTKTLLLRVLKYQYYMKLHIRKTDLNNCFEHSGHGIPFQKAWFGNESFGKWIDVEVLYVVTVISFLLELYHNTK